VEAGEDYARGVQLAEGGVSSVGDYEGGEALERIGEEVAREDSLEEVDQGAGEAAGVGVVEDSGVHKIGADIIQVYSSYLNSGFQRPNLQLYVRQCSHPLRLYGYGLYERSSPK
jgi:hypothetical protein